MVDIKVLIALVPILPLIGFLLVALNTKRFVQGVVSIIACGSVLASFGISLALFILLLNAPEGTQYTVTLFDWINAGSFSSSISFLIDPLSSLMLLIITGVGFLIHV